MDALVLGSAVIDLILHTSKEFTLSTIKNKRFILIPFDSKTEIKKLAMEPGGSAHNISVNLGRLENNVNFCGKIGNDFNGSLITNWLKVNGISTECIKVTQDSFTGFSFVFLKDGEKTILTYRGANNLLGKEDLPNLDAKWFIFTSMISEKNIEAVEHAINIMKNSTIVANPSVSMISNRSKELKKFLTESNIAIMNEKEAFMLTGKKSIKDQLKSLNGLGPETVIITVGEEGCWLFENKKTEHVKTRKVKIVDTTGAGDSFTAGFIHAKMKGWDSLYSAQFASSLATMNTMTEGATKDLPSEEEVLKFLKGEL